MSLGDILRYITGTVMFQMVWWENTDPDICWIQNGLHQLCGERVPVSTLASVDKKCWAAIVDGILLHWAASPTKDQPLLGYFPIVFALFRMVLGRFTWGKLTSTSNNWLLRNMICNWWVFSTSTRFQTDPMFFFGGCSENPHPMPPPGSWAWRTPRQGTKQRYWCRPYGCLDWWWSLPCSSSGSGGALHARYGEISGRKLWSDLNGENVGFNEGIIASGNLLQTALKNDH